MVGVRWKLSGSVVGFQIFESDKVKKKNANKRKPKQSSGNELTFAVIKVLTILAVLSSLTFVCFLFFFTVLHVIFFLLVFTKA